MDWEDPVELAQSLTRYLESSGSNYSTIFSALDSVEEMESPPEYFHAEETRELIEASDEALDEAWELLDTGDDPLMAPGNVVNDPEGGEFDYLFAESADARSRLKDIESALDEAVAKFSDAQDIVEAAGEVNAGDIAGNLGVYETLADFMKYVHSELHAMQRMAHEAHKGV